jgi:hypothetical protein
MQSEATKDIAQTGESNSNIEEEELRVRKKIGIKTLIHIIKFVGDQLKIKGKNFDNN